MRGSENSPHTMYEGDKPLKRRPIFIGAGQTLQIASPPHILLGSECQGCTAYISFFHKVFSVCKDRKGRSLVSWLEWRIVNISICLKSSLVAQRLKRLPAMQETWVRSLGWEDSWRRKWQPTPAFLPGESHGWRSQVGYSQKGCKESDAAEHRAQRHQYLKEEIWLDH